MKNIRINILPILLLLAFLGCKERQDPPVIISVTPDFAPVESLVTIEGENLEGIQEIYFSNQLINFNTAYNADHALLLRVPTNVPVADHVVEINTSGGSTTFNFRVTEDAPFIEEFLPVSGVVGDEITIYGKNFYEPLEVFFFDSIPAEIIFHSLDSVKVLVPEGTQKGRIALNANGGKFSTSKNFFIATDVLVNDFDGNGLRSETENWFRQGFVDQANATEAVQNMIPTPLNNNFMKITGTGPSWLGGFASNFNDNFEDFGLTANINNSLLQFDCNNNGRDKTYLQVILLERDGSFNDFTETFKIDWNGWEKVSVPISRFVDFDGFTIDPAKIKSVKFHLFNEENFQGKLEVNIDNVKFVQIQ